MTSAAAICGMCGEPREEHDADDLALCDFLLKSPSTPVSEALSERMRRSAHFAYRVSVQQETRASAD